MIQVGQNLQSLAEGPSCPNAGGLWDSLVDRPAVIHFFPLSFSDGCQIQNKRFCSAHKQLAAAGAEVFGISTDPRPVQVAFGRMLSLPYPLISDESTALGAAFGVLQRDNPSRVHRAMFVVDTTYTVRFAWISPDDYEVFPDPQEALKALSDLDLAVDGKTG